MEENNISQEQENEEVVENIEEDTVQDNNDNNLNETKIIIDEQQMKDSVVKVDETQYKYEDCKVNFLMRNGLSVMFKNYGVLVPFKDNIDVKNAKVVKIKYLNNIGEPNFTYELDSVVK